MKMLTIRVSDAEYNKIKRHALKHARSINRWCADTLLKHSQLSQEDTEEDETLPTQDSPQHNPQ